MKTVTVWVMALFLFAPITTIITPKTNSAPTGIEVVPNTAHAQATTAEQIQAIKDCKVVNAIFNPSNTGYKGDKLSDRFYKGRQEENDKLFLDTQDPVKIQVETEKCSGQTLTLQIHAANGVGGSESNVDIENGDGNGKTQNYVNFTITDKKTVTIELLPGEQGCAVTGDANDCQTYLRIYNSAMVNSDPIFHTDKFKNEPGRDNQRGELAYECAFDGTESFSSTFDCTSKYRWRLTKIEFSNSNVDILYYYKYTNSNIYYIAEKSPDVATCKAFIDDLATKNPGKSVDTVVGAGHSCINNPPATDISEKDSSIDQGKSIGTAELPPCHFLNWTIVGCVGVFLRGVVWNTVAWFAALVGQLFDFVFMYSISSAPYQNQFIEYAWSFVRDICNASFIFILLYIAIMTVLNKTKNVDYRQVIPKIIIVALIVNFSLFFGRVIIDFGNVSARLLYRSDVVNIKNPDGSYGSISGALIDSFDPQNLVINGAENFNQVTGLDGGGVDSVGFIVITIMSILMLFTFMKVLLEVSFIFIGRIVGLWMQLILAPIAFVAEALPFKVSNFMGTGSDSRSSWFTATLNQSIQATVFTFFLYITLLFSSMGIVSLSGVNGATSGVGFFLAMILPYLVIMVLLKTAKDKTASMATAIAKQATAVVQSAVGTISKVGLLAAGAAIAPVAGRAIGGLAAKMSNSSTLKSLSARAGKGNFLTKGLNNFIADTASKTSSGLSNFSKNKFDLRENALVKGAFSMAGFGDTKKINTGIGGDFGKMIDKKLESAGNTSRLQGLDAMQKAETEKMEQRLSNMKLTENNIDKDKIKDDRKKTADWLAAQRKAMNIEREAAKAAGTTFDEKAFKATYEAGKPKPKLNYSASATTKDAKVIADLKNKALEKLYVNRMNKQSKEFSLGDKLGFKPNPIKSAQKKFAKDKNKALEKSKRRRSVLNSELEKIAKQEVDTQKNINKLTTEMNALVSVLSQKNIRSKFAPNVDSYKEILDKKMVDPIFSARVADLSNRTKYPADHPAVKQLERDIRKAAGDAYGKQYEKSIDDAKKARDDAKIQFDIVKNDNKDPNYVQYKKEYEKRQKEFAGIEADVSKVKKIIEKANKKEESLEKEAEKRSGHQTQRRKNSKALNNL